MEWLHRTIPQLLCKHRWRLLKNEFLGETRTVLKDGVSVAHTFKTTHRCRRCALKRTVTADYYDIGERGCASNGI